MNSFTGPCIEFLSLRFQGPCDPCAAILRAPVKDPHAEILWVSLKCIEVIIEVPGGPGEIWRNPLQDHCAKTVEIYKYTIF